MTKLRVGVLRGGPSSEYDVSLKTGGRVLRLLDPGRFEPLDILITKDGNWHWRGLPIQPEQAADEVDLFFNCLHGEYGEDGEVQRLLARLNRPFTGPEEIPAMTAINKQLTKNLLARAGLKVPPSLLVTTTNPKRSARLAFDRLPPPWIIKPLDRGSSIGVALARSFDELARHIELIRELANEILIEQYVSGKEAAVGVVDNFRNHRYYPLLPVEIRKPPDQPIWTQADKYASHIERQCPGCFTDEEKQELMRLAITAHESLGLRHYSRSDFIVSSRGIYLLEADALPGLTIKSLLPLALKAVGVTETDFLTHQAIEPALTA